MTLLATIVLAVGVAISAAVAGALGLIGQPSQEAQPDPAATAQASASAAAPTPTPTPTPTGPVVGGWYAGASGLGVADGSFQRWLEQPVTIAGTWADQDGPAQTKLTPLTTEYRKWTGAMDIAIAGTVLGSDENYAAAAEGAYDTRWQKAAKNLAAARAEVKAPTFVRLFHEMNGFWYDNWVVTRSNAADYRAAHSRYVRILRATMPNVYISWSPNFRDHTGLPIEEWYPGDAVVDCVAPDYYDDDDNPGRLSVSAWNAEADDVDDVGNPLGPEAWRRFALEHGKPLCFPETGLKPSGGSVDHPQWIKAFNLWMNTHANTATWHLGQPIPPQAAGKVLYSIYFNVPHDDLDAYTIHGRGANPKSERMFRALEWGRRP